MLRSLYIQNYALIEKLDISFETGFSVITGETGAGKSIILGAIGLLLGQRADVKAIRHGASKCIIEARFDISAYGMRPFFEENELEYDEECILRREVQSSGKSRAFINDTPASLAQVKELGEQLIDVHSQHQNLLLNKEGFQSSGARRMGIKYFTVLIQLLTGKKITDPTSGLRMVNRDVMKIFAYDYPKDYPEPESVVAILRQKKNVEEIPVIMKAREGGVSSISPKKSVYYMIKVTLAILIERIRK